MKTSVYFSNDEVKITRGESRGENIRLNYYETIKLPEGVLINGVITDEDSLKDILTNCLNKEKFGSKAGVVVDSSSILYKTLDVPFMKTSELREVVRREFELVDSQYEEQIYDYSVLESRNNDGKQGRILCCSLSRQMLDSYKSLFRKLNIQLESLDTGLNCIIKAMSLLPEIKGSDFIVSTIENNIMACYLFAKGKFLFFNRTRLESEAGTVEYASEMAGRLSAMNQFYKSEKGNVAIENAYFYGINEEIVNKCSDSAGFLNIKISLLPESNLVNLQMKGESAEDFMLGNYLAPIGSLIER